MTQAEAAQAGEARIGGKAAGLARLDQAGASVPMWWSVPVEAFKAHVTNAGLDGLVTSTLANVTKQTAAAAAGTLGQAIRSAPLDPTLIHATKAALDGHSGPWAVRSSVVGEDSASQSFAGMFDSFVFLEDTGAVCDAIVKCWASAFTGRTLAYQLEATGRVEPPAMALVIQQAVAGEASGVIFTSNPVSGNGDEVLISAAWGLAEGVVSGRADTDEYVIGHDGYERSANVPTKDTMLVAGPHGVTETHVPAGQRRRRALTRDEMRGLAHTAVELAAKLGAPQDMEWTYAGGKLYLLQSRPITAKAATNPLGGRRTIWDNSNIQESFNGVTTPLTFSVAVRAYASVYEQSLRLVGVAEETISEHRPVLRNMIGLVDGRVYYNIESWYRCLLLLPSFDRSKEDMERMMGLEHPVDIVEGITLNPWEQARKAASLAPVGARLALEFRRLESSVDKFLGNFDARTAHIDRDALKDASFDELLTLADRLDDEVVGDWTTPIVNDLYCMTTTGRVRKRLLGAGHADPDELIAGLLSGEDDIESMEPTRRLLAIAKRVRSDRALAYLLTEQKPAAAIVKSLREFSQPLDAEFAHFMRRYGDRCMGEMKLETYSLRQDPAFVVQVLRNYVANPGLDAETLASGEHARRLEFEQLAARGMSMRERKGLQEALADARKAVKWRENMRLARTRFVGLYRDIYLAAGERLHEAGLLNAARDILYLTRDELTAYHEGTAVSTNLAAVAELRKAEFVAYDHSPGALPNHFETVGGVYKGSRIAPAGAIQSGRVLRGIGCSAGVVTGQLRVIDSPEDDLDVSGRILTAMRTDPGWTPLFPSASGILVERGSTLSHSAVLAREFGIPAVVGIPGLLETVKDGERVKLDGGAGSVERLDYVE
jgi:pyruvate,water dikinase